MLWLVSQSVCHPLTLLYYVNLIYMPVEGRFLLLKSTNLKNAEAAPLHFRHPSQQVWQKINTQRMSLGVTTALDSRIVSRSLRSVE